MKYKSFCSKVLKNLKTVFDGSSMEVSSTEDRIYCTSKNGVGYNNLDIALTFDDEKVIIEGIADGLVMSYYDSDQNFGNPERLYDDFEDLYEYIKGCVIDVYGEVNAELMENMFNY